MHEVDTSFKNTGSSQTGQADHKEVATYWLFTNVCLGEPFSMKNNIVSKASMVAWHLKTKHHWLATLQVINWLRSGPLAVIWTHCFHGQLTTDNFIWQLATPCCHECRRHWVTGSPLKSCKYSTCVYIIGLWPLQRCFKEKECGLQFARVSLSAFNTSQSLQQLVCFKCRSYSRWRSIPTWQPQPQSDINAKLTNLGSYYRHLMPN